MIVPDAMPAGARAIGIDLGGTNLRVAQVGRDGTVAGRVIEPIRRDPDALLTRLVTLCRSCDGPDVVGIGIGIPGRVDARHRVVLSGGYLDLSGTDVASRIEQAVGKPVSIDNDCSMALGAEMALGAARYCANVAMFTIGTGIGGAIALDGRIARGGATAGQLGHLTVQIDGEVCACGRRGCVETTSSGTALGRLIREAGLPPDTRVEALIEVARHGDARPASVLDRWARPLRDAIDSIVAAICPDVVLLGGGLGAAAAAALERVPVRAAWFRCPVRVAALDEGAGLIGAGLTALRNPALGLAIAEFAP